MGIYYTIGKEGIEIKKKKNNKKYKLSKKRLTRYEYDKYLEIGEIDSGQNWLELFTPTRVGDLFTILNSDMPNHAKAELITKEYGPMGFEPLGLGTNVYAMSNPAYPGVCFKFALDSNGLMDNYRDRMLSKRVNRFLMKHGERPRYTKVLATHPSYILTVQARKPIVQDQDRMDSFRGSIIKVLRLLSQEFLIIDLSPTLYRLNYGVDPDGEWCFIDASDLFPLDEAKKPIRCGRQSYEDRKHEKIHVCTGRLRYNDDFSAVICTECGAERLPVEVRPQQERRAISLVGAMSDGMSSREIDEMRRMEMARIVASEDPGTEDVHGEAIEDETPFESEDYDAREDESTRDDEEVVETSPEEPDIDDEDDDVTIFGSDVIEGWTKVTQMLLSSKSLSPEDVGDYYEEIYQGLVDLGFAAVMENHFERLDDELDEEDIDQETESVSDRIGVLLERLQISESADPDVAESIRDDVVDQLQEMGFGPLVKAIHASEMASLQMVQETRLPKRDELPTKDNPEIIRADGNSTVEVTFPGVRYAIETIDEIPYLKINLSGDPLAAIEEYGLNAQLTIDEGKTWATALSGTAFNAILRPIIVDLQEEAKMFGHKR